MSREARQAACAIDDRESQRILVGVIKRLDAAAARVEHAMAEEMARPPALN
jgi:hypothetical protein